VANTDPATIPRKTKEPKAPSISLPMSISPLIDFEAAGTAP